ncbi:hypothetical protein DKX38_007022 [Salix brachista]|uniref:Small ribosomal subunit protein mS41 SAM domain-containing protein n=1 Tax=Salix brachista TaxID=2182728 RepID=A0A5N5MNZ1_9ROSI|nr:hypothetical protein DKX38_007022 [Salix brachista]
MTSSCVNDQSFLNLQHIKTLDSVATLLKPKNPIADSSFTESGSEIAMAWRQIFTNTKRAVSIPPQQATSAPGLSRFFSKSSSPYLVKVGIPEFLNGIGKGVEAHVAKLESEIGDFHKLLVTRTLKLKKLGIPCQQRKLILKYAHKYRVGLWRPRAQPVKAG